VVERRDVFGHLHGVQQRGEQHARRQLHVGHLRRQAREHGDGLEMLEGMDEPVMAPGHERKAGVLRRANLLQVLAPLPLKVVALRDHLADMEAELHDGRNASTADGTMAA
jgi:hypothetical protein